VAAIYDKLGEDAQEKIMSNPYSICDYLSIRKLPLADKIALNTGVSALSKIRVSKIIQYYLTYHGYNSGDMYMVCDYLYKSLYSFAKKTGFYLENISEEYFGEILEYMQEMKTVVIEDISGERLIYLKAFYTIESNTAKLIKEINERKYSPLNPNTYDTFFAKLVANTGIVADETQKAAVRTAYENRFCVLTGGPGTGKTQTINTIIAFIESQKKTSKIVLCAPTGRAAKRMSELTGKDAYTIHRLLGIMGDDEYGNSYSYDLDADFVICDEASMIDAPLFYKLITAVADSKNASLLLVGDKDQLPPVGAGMPFKDIIESKKVPTVILEKLYRQASRSQINRNARLILAGVTQIGGGGLTFDKSLQDFFFFETGDVAFQRTLILKSIEQLLNVGTSMDDIMILSPVRKTALGVEEINKLVQNFINPLNNRVEFNTPLYSLRVKDRVMQTSNNYELGVFNGDIGVITSIDTKDEEITVSYDDSYIKDGVVQPGKKDVVYSFPLARELVLAYATTVHKSQGSEYPVAIMPLSPMFFNLSRNILYTAVTRAKKRCVLIGDRQSLINGIIKNDNTQRRTKLKERI
jgi:exodeoxyribonuclease V alpha subunit